jgi:hypothetical protein
MGEWDTATLVLIGIVDGSSGGSNKGFYTTVTFTDIIYPGAKRKILTQVRGQAFRNTRGFFITAQHLLIYLSGCN